MARFWVRTSLRVSFLKGSRGSRDPKDPEAVADAVTRLHGDADLRQRLQVEGPRVASQHRWARSVQGYWEEVTAAVAERAA